MCLRGIRVGMHDLTGKEQQFQHAYDVTGRGCRISRARNIRSNMPTRHQVGAAGSHGLGTIDRTCLLCIRSGLQDLTRSKHQIERIYEVSHGFGTTDHMPTRYQDGAARSHGFGTPDRRAYQDGAARSHG